MRTVRTMLVCATVCLAACGNDASRRGGPSVVPDAGDSSVADSGSSISMPNIDADGMCAKIEASVAACVTTDHATCVTAFNTANERGCGEWLDDLETWVESSAAPYMCQSFGSTTFPAMSPGAPQNAQIGDACTAAIVRNSCYGIACENFTDCPSGWSCNEAIGHCFDSASTSCAGVPCNSFTDCATGDSCNEAVGICIHS